MKRRPTRRQDIQWGLSWGAALASLFALYVIVLFLLRGSEPFDGLGVSLSAVLSVYFFGGLAGGAVVGLLRPMATSCFASMAIGILVAAPIASGIVFSLAGPPSHWGDSHIFAAVFMTLLYGIGGGYIAWTFWRN